jgi:hypothetical protein
LDNLEVATVAFSVILGAGIILCSEVVVAGWMVGMLTDRSRSGDRKPPAFRLLFLALGESVSGV